MPGEIMTKFFGKELIFVAQKLTEDLKKNQGNILRKSICTSEGKIASYPRSPNLSIELPYVYVYVHKLHGIQNDRLTLTVSTQKSVLKNMHWVLRY